MPHVANPAEEPNITDWMQGWSGVIGVAVGLLAALFTGLLLLYEIRTGRRVAQEAARDRAEAAEDRELARAERRDAEAQQARTVVISDVEIGGADIGYVQRVRMSMANYGPGPVLEVVVYLVVGPEIARARLAGQNALGPMEVMKIDVRPELTPSDLGDKGLVDQELLDAVSIEVTFTDMAGIRWKRCNSEQPERIVN